MLILIRRTNGTLESLVDGIGENWEKEQIVRRGETGV